LSTLHGGGTGLAFLPRHASLSREGFDISQAAQLVFYPGDICLNAQDVFRDLFMLKITDVENSGCSATGNDGDTEPAPSVPAAAPQDTPAASVVVPTCGRPDLLDRCLSSLAQQQCDRSGFEIIVVDDAPAPATRAVVEKWAGQAASDRLSISYLASTGPHGPAAARNVGWKAARSGIVAFTDDDTIAAPDWLSNGLRAFDHDVQAVWGRIEMPVPAIPTDYERDAKNLENAEFVTANCFCRKQVLMELGGFDERFQFAWREDSDFYFRLLGRPGRIMHAPSAKITHPVRPGSWGVSLRQQKKIQSDALLYKKHPRLYRNKIRAVPRWDYYAIVLLLLTSIAASALGQPALAAGAGSVWLLLSARFCLARLQPTLKTPSHIAEMIVTSALIPPLAVFWRMVGAVKFRVRFF
jgi:glycosyltransferase involved in cell wall biosynthesis